MKKTSAMTIVWCMVTSGTTLVISHGHLIVKELMKHWPKETAWESRFETALYTQGGLTLLAGIVISCGVMLRGWYRKRRDEEIARRDRNQRERQAEEEKEQRELHHRAMLEALSSLGGNPEKKIHGSGSEPRKSSNGLASRSS